jgi:hypothetical protein
LLLCLYSALDMFKDVRPDFFYAMVEVVIQTTFRPECVRRVRVDCARRRSIIVSAIRSKPTARVVQIFPSITLSPGSLVLARS